MQPAWWTYRLCPFWKPATFELYKLWFCTNCTSKKSLPRKTDNRPLESVVRNYLTSTQTHKPPKFRGKRAVSELGSASWTS